MSRSWHPEVELIKDGTAVTAEAKVFHVAHYADDLHIGMPSLGRATVLHAPADRIFAGKVLSSHAFADHRHAGRVGPIAVVKALGRESHVRRHLVHLATAKRRIWSYVEHVDITAIDEAATSGGSVLRRIARNTTARNVDHRVVFGFAYRNAPTLVAFLKNHQAHLEAVTGIRYSGEFGHPFHVIDDDVVIVCVDHPFVPQGRVASLMVRDAALSSRLAEGFETLWAKAMRSLREISFQPGH